ncbi:MAG: DUF1800 domain-containing protein [Chitinophagaceae bacterium]
MSIRDDKAKVQHLSWRAGFGAEPAYINKWDHKNWNHFFRKVMKGGEKSPQPITVPEAAEIAQLQKDRPKKLTKEERIDINKIQGQGMRNLIDAWMDEMVTTDHPLREKMAFFWHGHFACRIDNVFFNQMMLDVIRQNALGNFGDLLFGISKSPAMLQFLNNQQNRKQHANENFGREVMELFTMGIGNYTEEDVKQGSRAFTGWGFNKDGDFVFRKNQHDFGVKTFLGKTGNFNGNDILNIILEQKATAHHITEKICRFFVNDNPDTEMVNDFADKFYKSNYDISSLMESLFKSPEFYKPENTGNLIKSPVELLVGLRRTIPVNFGKDQVQILLQRIMDQVPFYPPNVGGWPGGKDWIDSSTLLFRMRLPQIIYYSGEITIRPKDMPDELTDTYTRKNPSDEFVKNFAKRVDVTVNWDSYLNSFKDIPENQLPTAIADALLTDAQKADSTLLNKFADSSSTENYIKSLSIDIMSSPEYQLC